VETADAVNFTGVVVAANSTVVAEAASMEVVASVVGAADSMVAEAAKELLR
jgi:hypothetical protein